MMSLSRRAAAAGILHVLKSYSSKKAQKRSDEGVAKEREIDTHTQKVITLERLNHNSNTTNIDA